MLHIALNSAEPGIRGLLRYRPETGRPLSELAEVLLRGPSTLDGLATATPDDSATYAAGAQRLVAHGYLAGLPEPVPRD